MGTWAAVPGLCGISAGSHRDNLPTRAMPNREAPSLHRIVTTSFDVAFPIFMGLGLAALISLMIACLFQSIAWDAPRIKISAATAVLVPLVLLGGTGLVLAWRIQGVFRSGRVVPGTVLSKRMTWRRVLAVRFSYELGPKIHRRTVYLLPQPQTELLQPGCSIDVILPGERMQLWALIRQAYE